MMLFNSHRLFMVSVVLICFFLSIYLVADSGSAPSSVAVPKQDSSSSSHPPPSSVTVAPSDVSVPRGERASAPQVSTTLLEATITTTTVKSSDVAAASPSLFRSDWKAWLSDLKKELGDDGAENLRSAIIEVGTGSTPDFCDIARSRGAFYIGVDPIHDPERLTRNCCAGMRERCMFVQAAVVGHNSNKTVTIHRAHRSHCSSLLSGGRRCAASNATVVVSSVTLGELVFALPPSLMRKIDVATDCQGADLLCIKTLQQVSSDGVPALMYVRSIIAECQDLPPRDRQLQYWGQFTCAELNACLTSSLFEPSPAADAQCSQNFEVAEYNCHWRRRGSRHGLRHPHKNDTQWKIKRRAHCPAIWYENRN